MRNLALIALLCLALPLCAQTDSSWIRPVQDTSAASPVVLDGDTLFVLRTGALGFPPSMRAAAIAERVRAYADELLPVDSVTAREADVGSLVVAGDRLLLTVFDADAEGLGVTRGDLAQDYAGRIREAVAHYREEYSARGLVRGGIIALAATVLLIVLLKVGNRLLSRALRRLDSWVEFHVPRTGAVVSVGWLRPALGVLAKGVKVFLLVVLLYAYLEVVLNSFAWTRPIAASLLSFILSPLKLLWGEFVGQLPNLVFLAVLAVLTRLFLRAIRFLFGEIERGRVTLPGFYPDWSRPTYNIVRVLVIAFALVVAFPYIPGSSSAAFQGVSIFIGVLLSLGSSSAVANVVAGVILTYMRAFKTGDYVRISDTVGTVVGSNLLVTRILTPKNVEITVPNSSILATHVTNYSMRAREKQLILNTTVTIGYDAPWRQVHALLTMAAEKTRAVLKDPAPFVLQNSLDDFYVTYELNAYTDDAVNMVYTYADLHKNIQDLFNEYGVQIMSPNYLADRPHPTVVPKERWYAAPAKQPGEAGADA
jgi:small-conductance mechanosensitive channel